MRKVRGLVLKSTANYLYLLGRGGEYLKIPARGRRFAPGREIEVTLPLPWRRLGGIAASLILVIALSFVVQVAVAQPEAYLALDINPSLLLSLNSEAIVIRAEGLNKDGELVLRGLKIKGKDVSEALELLLEKASEDRYLSAEDTNTIFVSLAAPENYCLAADDIRSLLSHKILSLELDSYLKVGEAEPEVAVAAKKESVSLNARELGEELSKKGFWDEHLEKEEEGSAAFQDYVKGGGPPPPVKDFLEVVKPEKIFKEKEFVRGKSAEKRPEHAVGPPDGVPPGQRKKHKK